MKLFAQVGFLLRISSSREIVRRYFVVNGFDGALTMLGLIIGFMLSNTPDLTVVINACLGAAVALGMSGLSSAYISEAAERQRALNKLEQAMSSDLQDSAHGLAARLAPWVIALVNGLAPFIISLLIILPLWLASGGVEIALPPLLAAALVALSLVFFLGMFLGRVAGTPWLRSGLLALLIALVTAGLIYVFAGH